MIPYSLSRFVLRRRTMKRKVSLVMISILLISMISFLGNISGVRASGSTIRVGPTQTYTTIQAAINAASPGDTILVDPGTYYEQVTINKSLSVTSTGGAGQTFINASGLSAEAGSDFYLVLINAPGNVSFEGFTVKMVSNDAYDRFGIFTQCTTASPTYIIKNNVIIGTGNVSDDEDYGFYAQSGMENDVFTYNTVTQTGCDNIMLEQHNGTTEISHNNLDAGIYGIDAIFAMAYNGRDVTALQNVSYNTFTMNTGEAFDYDHRATAISFCTPGAAWGLSDAHFTNVVIQGNVITGLNSNGRGIGFWNGGGSGGGTLEPLIIGNTITGLSTSYTNSSGVDFIGAGASVDANVTLNTITNVNQGVLLRTDSCAPDLIIHYNNILSNAVGVNSTVQPESAVDARFNWWGDNSGPGGIGPGSGQPIYGNITYSPWLTAHTSSIVQLTVTSAHDSSNPSGTTSYLFGTSVTASVASLVFGSTGTQYVCTGWTGTGDVPSSGTGTIVTFTITQDSTITWNWKTQYSVTFNQAGVGSDFIGTVMTIGGNNYDRNGVTFWWDSNSIHSFSFAPLLPAGGEKQYVWNSTAGLSTAQSGTLTVTGSGNVTGEYKTQYQITFDQSGVGNGFNGTIVSIDGTSYNRTQLPTVFMWDNNSVHSFSYASPLTIDTHTVYTWSSTTGLSTLQSGSLTVTAPGSVVASYVIANEITFDQVGINSSKFAGPVLVIDGTNYTAAQLPMSFSWKVGDTHTFAYYSPLTNNANTKRYVWVSTSGLSLLQSSSLTVTTYGSIVASYNIQYYLTLTTSPNGVNSPSGQGWHAAGAEVPISTSQYVDIITGSSRYSFSTWNTTRMLEISNPGSISTTVYLDAPKTVTAEYVTQYYLAVASSYDSPTPLSGWFNSGTSVTESIASPVPGSSGTQYRCTGWTGTGSVPPSGSDLSLTFTINSPSTITWNWKTQYFLNVQTSPANKDSPSGQGWYDAGAHAGISTTPDVTIISGDSRYDFRGWTTNDMTEIANPMSPSTTVLMDQAKTVTANYVTQHNVTFDQSGVGNGFNGTIVSIDGTSYNRTQLPTTFWWDYGSVHGFSYASPLAVGNGKQYVWNSTTIQNIVFSNLQSGTLTVKGSGTVIGNYKTQYRIMFSETGVGTDFSGTVVSIDGTNYDRNGVTFWWDAGSVYSYSFASPLIAVSTQYLWGSTSGLSTLQSGSLTVTSSGGVFGNYVVQNAITFDKLGVGSDFTGTVVVIDGTSYTAAQLPVHFYWTVGTTHTFAYQSPLTVGASTEQYVWTSTTGLSSVRSGSITVTTYGSIVGNYKTQYFLTVAADPAGLGNELTRNPAGQSSGAGWWYDASTSVTLTATSAAHYSFDHWTVDGNSQGNGVNPIGIVMDAPHNAVGHYVLNVEVLNISAKTVVGCGLCMPITITVKNRGSTAETFNVTIYLNTTPYNVQQFVMLGAGASRTLTYSLNTTGCAYGNYTLSASAWIRPGETGNYTYGTVKVTIPGDINGDGVVGTKDLHILGVNWGLNVPPADPNADINGDGTVGTKDLHILGVNWGLHL